jgi:uncharacterized protein YbjT (DUF2867 family)
MQQTILVIGGSGMLGEPVARQLLADGYRVRLLTRNPDNTKQKFGNDFEVVHGDVEDDDSIRRSLQGCMGVHISLMGGPRPEDFERIEHLGTARVARIAAEMGVAHLTYLSGAPALEQNFRDPGSKAKYLAEAAILQSGVPYTIFRATWMMESLPLFIRGKKALVIGQQAHPLRWLAAQDYAGMVSRAYRLPAAQNKRLFILGPESYTKPEALTIYTQIVRPDVKVVRIPLWLMSILAKISLNAQLQNDVRRMAFYNEIGDDFGDPTEANALLGAPTTTLREWCEDQKRLRNG